MGSLHTPTTPIAAFVKRLRCRRCGSQSVLATRKPLPGRKGLRDVWAAHRRLSVARQQRFIRS
jgi:hypothetical protein